MFWARAQQRDDGSYVIPKSWLNLHYFEAANLLFRIENSLRVFVYAVLKAELGPEWLNASIAADDDAGGTSSPVGSIQSVGRKRLKQTKAFGYLGYVSPSPLLYISMGELIGLMFSDAYWPHFAPHFLGAKSTMRMKLDEINVIRNALAHFRPLKEDDVDVIRQNAKHAMMGIEAFLAGLTQCNDVVPTNSTDSWYIELSSLGSGCLQLQLKQNSKRDRVEVLVTFSSPAMGETRYETARQFNLVKLDSPAVLRVFPQLRAESLHLTESQTAYIDNDAPFYQKSLSFVFSRKAIEERTNVIAKALRELIVKLNNELELLSNDNLARGELLSVTQVWAWWLAANPSLGSVAHWSVNVDALASPPGDDDPAEYWGNLGWLGREFITQRDKYPWMASTISGVDF